MRAGVRVATGVAAFVGLYYAVTILVDLAVEQGGEITVSRVHGSTRFPADFMLVAALNPTHAGGNPIDGKRDKYLDRLSGPLLDRIDIHVEVPTVNFHEMSSKAAGTDSATMRRQVQAARARQLARFNDPALTNARMDSKRLNQHVKLGDAAKRPDQYVLMDRVRREVLPPYQRLNLRTQVAPVNEFGGGTDAGALLGLLLHLVLALGAHHVHGHVHQVAHHGLHVAPDVAHLGELGGLHLDEGRLGELRETPGNLRLPDAGGANHDDVLRVDFVAQVVGDLLAAPAVAQGDRHRALGVVLPDDVALLLADDLAGREG